MEFLTWPEPGSLLNGDSGKDLEFSSRVEAPHSEALGSTAEHLGLPEAKADHWGLCGNPSSPCSL